MIIVISILLAIIVLLFMYIFLVKNDNTKRYENSKTIDNDSTLLKEVKMRQYIGIKEINNNFITTKDNEVACILDVSTPEFSLMTESDQTNYENGLMEFIFKLNYSLKIITIVVNKDLKNVIKKLEENKEKILNENLKQYSVNLQKELMKEQQQHECKKYYVIYEKNKSKDNIKELEKKVNRFITEMENANCTARILTTKEIIKLLNKQINKYTSINLEELEKNKAFAIAT